MTRSGIEVVMIYSFQETSLFLGMAMKPDSSLCSWRGCNSCALALKIPYPPSRYIVDSGRKTTVDSCIVGIDSGGQYHSMLYFKSVPQPERGRRRR
jgi:hypothetical protein